MSPLQNCKSNSFMASSWDFDLLFCWSVITLQFCFITKTSSWISNIYFIFYFPYVWMCFSIYRMTEEATSGNPWAPDARTLRSISRDAFELDDYWRIVEILHKRYFQVPLFSLPRFPLLCQRYGHVWTYSIWDATEKKNEKRVVLVWIVIISKASWGHKLQLIL